MSKPSQNEPLLVVRDLCTSFPSAGGPIPIVRSVSLDVHRGKTLGLVGESGSGKSTLARTVLGLIPASGGSVRFDGQELLGLTPRQWRPLRRRMQMVFQDPAASLNPRMTVAAIIGEGLRVHGLCDGRADSEKRVAGLLERVGLRSSDLPRHPHEFSGGQKQRIGIARALAVEPELIVCDEPVSALDVSIQSQILNLLSDLQDELGLSYLFIAHDLAVVRAFCDDVAVMQRGEVVEQADADTLVEHPQHPYTQTLLRAAGGGLGASEQVSKSASKQVSK